MGHIAHVSFLNSSLRNVDPDESRGFRGPISVPVTGGGSLKRPMQKPRPKPST